MFVAEATAPSEACEVCDTLIIFLKNMLSENATEVSMLLSVTF